MTMLVFQSPGLVENARRTHVGGRELYYHDVGGRIVSISQHGGMKYSFFVDLDLQLLFQLEAKARVAY